MWFPLGAYAASRLFTLVVVLICQRAEIALPASNGIIRIMYPTDEAPGYWVVMGNWDGQWYRQIADVGYPNSLPRDDFGRVDMNAWAFFPLYPMIVRLLTRVTGGDFYVVGGLTALVLGAVAMVLLYRLVDRAVGRWEAVVAVVGVCTFISAPILQATYTESLALLLVVLTLLLLRARRYWWVAGVLVLLALTRNVVVAMVPVLLAHGFVRWRSERDAFPIRDRIVLGALTVEAAALTFMWPAIVAEVTGNRAGYAETMQAWRVGTNLKLSMWWNYLLFAYDWIGPVAGIGLVLAFGWFLLSRRSWRWGPELWGWAGAYPAYQLLVTTPGPSRLRYALLAFPFTLILAWFLRLKWCRRWQFWGLVGVVLLGLAQQVWWIQNFLIVSHLDGVIYYP
jgi:hypothetical protein